MIFKQEKVTWAMSDFSTPDYSSILTKRSQKRLPHMECIAFHTLPHQRAVNEFKHVQASKQEEKPISYLMEKNLLQQVTSAFQEQLKEQKSVHHKLTSLPLPNPHSPLFLYNKINFLHKQNNDYQRFHWRNSMERTPQPLLSTTPAPKKLISIYLNLHNFFLNST